MSWVEGPRAIIVGYQSESWTLGIAAKHNLRKVSLVAPTVKNPPSMQEKQVQFLDQKDSLEKRMATHSSILAWRIVCTEEPGVLQSMVSRRVGHD